MHICTLANLARNKIILTIGYGYLAYIYSNKEFPKNCISFNIFQL